MPVSHAPNGLQTPYIIGAGIGGGGPPPVGGENKVWYVDSNASSGGDALGNGKTPETAFATLAYAVSTAADAEADEGPKADDQIHVAPGHAETVSAAAGIDIDTAGLIVWGFGEGSRKPTITLNTATTADVDIDAANVWVHGIRFVSAVDSLAVILDVNEDFARITNCDFVSTSTFEYINAINLATTKDNFVIDGCRFEQPTDPAGTDGAANTGAIYLVDSENVFVRNCAFLGNFETAMIHNLTTGCTNLWIENCFGISSLAGSEPIQLVSTATGGMIRCSFITPAETLVGEATLSGTFPDGFFNFQSLFGNDGGGGQTAVASTADAT